MARTFSTDMTYDKAIRRVEEIVRELEQTEALSVSEYKTKAAEALKLLDFCQIQLTELEKSLSDKD